ncbi:APC family permease [Streptomyces sp. A7024]|uniref:APC family permease n=1 Tax=Streptomyces coryli TaxID=1128680 RepID=A0A6G4UA79_9ACTN|nr:APC family permease [Streptomyces coryli]NGN68596.1 APC family permease [Streptomyces coryli]
MHRELTFRDLVVYGMLFIAPMAPVGVFGALDAISGGSVALVYIAATIAMGFTAFSYAQMVRVAPSAGSVFAYARTGLGPGPGFVAGWMVMLDYLLIPAVAYLFSGIAMHALVPAVPAWMWTAAAMLITTTLNMAGVRTAAKVGFAVLAMEVLVLGVFVVSALVVLAREGPQRGLLEPLGGGSGFEIGAVLTGVSVALLSYLGFDAIAGFAEEARGGSRRVARALLVCLVMTGLLFVLQTYLAALISPYETDELRAHPERQDTAFYDIAEAGVGGWLSNLVAVSKAIGAAFAALAAQAAAARLLFAMARERRLPTALSRVDARSGAPRRALAASAVLAAVAAIWASRAGDGLSRLVTVVDIGALTAFALLHASVIAYFYGRRDAERSPDAPRPHPVKHVLIPVLGILICCAVIVKAAFEARVVGACWLVVGLAVLAWQRGRRGVNGSVGPGD